MSEDVVLHTLRCIGFADLSRVAEVSGLPASEVESSLIDLGVDGLVERTPPPFPSWGLTAAGKSEDARRVARELDAAGARAAVGAAFSRFLVLNPELLDLCSAALDPALPGDRVLARFEDLDRRAEAVCADLAAALPRFGRYRVRLSQALDEARAGRVEWLAASVDSYHGVWFQLHEDLLVTLGIPR